MMKTAAVRKIVKINAKTRDLYEWFCVSCDSIILPNWFIGITCFANFALSF